MATRRSLLFTLTHLFDSRALILALLLGSCASLESSKTDQEMRFQGSYTCDKTTQEKPGLKETLAEADVARIRCVKDEWKIDGQEIHFTRTLYQSLQCDVPLGQIQFSLPFKTQGQTLIAEHPKCELLRLNPSWLGEESGTCMLKDFALNKPYVLASAYHCKKYVPEVCHSSQVSIESGQSLGGSHEPYHQLRFTSKPSGASATCKRYASE